MQKLEPTLAGPLRAHKYETYDFKTMYPNIPDVALLDVMRKLLEYTFEHCFRGPGE